MPLVLLCPSDSIPASLPLTTSSDNASSSAANSEPTANIASPRDRLLPSDAAATLLALHHQQTTAAAAAAATAAAVAAAKNADSNTVSLNGSNARDGEICFSDASGLQNHYAQGSFSELNELDSVNSTGDASARRKGKLVARKLRASKALSDPLSPAPSLPISVEALSSQESSSSSRPLLPSPERDISLEEAEALNESRRNSALSALVKLPVKKIRKKTIEPKPDTWNKPSTMGDEDVDALDEHKLRILNETKNLSSFVVIGETLHKLYYEDRLMKTQKEFLEWTKAHLGFSKSTTYEYIISYRIYSDIASKLSDEYRPPMYQSHCQLLSKVPSKKLVDTWVDVCQKAPRGVITTAFLEAYLEQNNLKVPKSRIASHGSCADQQTDSKAGLEAVVLANLARQASESTDGRIYEGRAGSSSKAEPRNRTPRKSDSARGANQTGQGRTRGERSKLGKHARDGQDTPPDAGHPKRKNDSTRLPERAMSPTVSAAGHPPVAMPMMMQVSRQDSYMDEDHMDHAAEHARPRLPFNDGFIFELSKNVVQEPQFDMVMQTVFDFKAAEQQPWFGRLWCNLCAVRPFSTSKIYGSPMYHQDSYEGGLERLLEIIFTKYANKEFSEGLFLLRAELGADWFTPILQHPYCILRHNNPPMKASTAHPHNISDRDDDGDMSGHSPSGRRRSSDAGSSSAALHAHTPYESYVMFYLGPNIKEFCTVFRSVGLVPGINSWAAVLNLANVPGLFIPTPAPAPESMIEPAGPTDIHHHHSLNEAASALVEIAGIHHSPAISASAAAAATRGNGGGSANSSPVTNGHPPRGSQ
ncbi:hypothetical protein HDU87_003412 [Geranomyces variabilis]|uniref:Uncharacterized protein n=1 Tax=Geranomyces variabilis TaxID=109894 RepID=A0AAD5XN34_9FUNG|nr:hypothetical protein HDU87_003412 [Geranomyces variabilis]